MNVKELRIGNYIESPRGIEEIKYAESLEEIESSPDKFKGIPITEQWLLNFGFEKWPWCDDCAVIPLLCGNHMYCRFFNKQWHIKTISLGRDKKGFFSKSQGKYILPKGKIKHVHQLQNLYHALTGEELTIKE